ncbi:outer membrane protein assembly factor BamB family protein [Allorhodopirellula solitaria]|uniref:Outer membrane biogenesis protein BamB n=1 Tax=Allorhodopirellula solitaria TaxID=2527987 RepID=A0A5C5XTK0_9BACT|nr:PQQ-binding-like beta-propeller repeat protein [Allorhodopirellula solitaria]TWT66596.1 outer membrane biogenesis protein BamB [Allorhodopirellula solitaria]
MFKVSVPAAAVGLLLVASIAANRSAANDAAQAGDATTWPQWRGESQQGVAGQIDLPIQWDEAATKRIELPGSGGSTPVVAGQTAYLTSGVDGKNTLIAIDVDPELDAPEILWQVDLGEDRGNKHRKGSGSNPSAIIDGERVVAYFRSGDLACVDTAGEIIWHKNVQEQFGEDSLWWDLGSSPVKVGSLVVVAVMQTGPSYLAAFDIATGELKWKTDRITDAPEEAAQSYTTPLAVEINGQPAIATMGADHLTIHNAADGKELGRLGGFNPGGEKFFRSIASPVAEGNLIICPYSRGATLTAVDMSKLVAGAGQDAIVWFRDDIGVDVPTPALRDGVVYLISDVKHDKGTAYALDAETGETRWSVDLPRTRRSYSSSPLLVGDRMYITSEDAVTNVIEPLEENAEVVATNQVDDNEEYTVASPVPMSGQLGLRTKSHLYLMGN